MAALSGGQADFTGNAGAPRSSSSNDTVEIKQTWDLDKKSKE